MNISPLLNAECIYTSKPFNSPKYWLVKDIFLLPVLCFISMSGIHANAEMQRCSPLIFGDTQLPAHTTATSAWLIFVHANICIRAKPFSRATFMSLVRARGDDLSANYLPSCTGQHCTVLHIELWSYFRHLLFWNIRWTWNSPG